MVEIWPNNGSKNDAAVVEISSPRDFNWISMKRRLFLTNCSPISGVVRVSLIVRLVIVSCGTLLVNELFDDAIVLLLARNDGF